jgi:hypothetical protein
MTVSAEAFLLERPMTLILVRTVNMVLFIVPVSAFNQTLTEDRSVNRLVRLISLG